jgi:flagellar M-ring protein FliF
MSNLVSSWWSRAGGALRAAVLLASTLLLAAVVWVLFLLLRTEYGVLFTDLAPADAGAIVERLKRDKVPYQLAAGGRSIEVPAQRIHEVRIALMSGKLPLSGNVGFEIFDQQGFGTTEQAQQVSYQRALQGELARTISALDQVASVRVHLVLPQSSLFTRERASASAAVTLAMEPGSALEPGQIAGVQRLVAAAVAGLEPGKVVITDQRGITLSAGDAGVAGAADARLQVKREVESYLAKKVGDLLAGAFGSGQAIVTVDASLNFDNAKTTVQDVIPGPGGDGGEGVVVRRRQMNGGSGGASAVWASAIDGQKLPAQSGSSMEVEYQYGRRVAEVVTAPGAVARMSIGVIVPGPLAEEKRQRIAELVRVAAGFNELRGDAISVQALDELTAAVASRPDLSTLPITAPLSSEPAVQAAPTPALPRRAPFVNKLADWQLTQPQLLLAAPLAAALLLAVLIAWRLRRSRSAARARERLLQDLERALTDTRLLAARISQ